jgi:hypothetical protein
MEGGCWFGTVADVKQWSSVGFGLKIDLALEGARHMYCGFASFPGLTIEEEDIFLERSMECGYSLLERLGIPCL